MRLAVIGGVAAGLSAAARARRLDPGAEIVVLEKGNTISYGACGLPYFVEGRVAAWSQLLVYSPEYFRTQRNIEVRTGAAVTSIHHSRRRLSVAGGGDVSYDKLIIATGARQDRSAIPGADQPHVFSFQTLPEAIRLRDHLAGAAPGRAAVIGASYMGLEAVEMLRARGWRVSLISAGPHFLRRHDSLLDHRLSSHLARFRVPVIAGTRVRAIEPGGLAGLPAELVVLAAGLKPNVELALEAGVDIGPTGAIRVSEHLETNLGGVFAAGDCAETRHLVTGRPCWIPLGTTANKMGRAAGANAAGRRERFHGVAGTTIVRVCGLGVALTGFSEAQAKKEGLRTVSVHVDAGDRASYFRGRPTTVQLVADQGSGRLLGGMVLGEHGVEGRINVIATALAQAMHADEFASLDLAYAPPFSTVWDPLLIAAQQLLKLLQ